MPPESLPSGTVTFLFTDIEGSTRLLEELGPAYLKVMDQHCRIIREAIVRNDGHEVNTEGDSFFVAFPSAYRAVTAAAEMQQDLAAYPWPMRPLKVRMGLHSGEAARSGRDYIGLDVNRAARISAAGHGGQVLVSATTKALVEQELQTGPAGISLLDLGSHRLKDLPAPEHLYQLAVEGLASDFPPLRSLESTPGNLPEQMTPFFGRRRELSESRDLLSETRLLTLTGPGGSGKTRLGLQLAKRLVGSFADGVFFVPLATLREPELVMAAVAHALGMQESVPDLRRLVLDRLAARETLLILDNFEQLLPAAEEVSALLAGAPRLKILVTSRSPLGIYGEREYPVPPLAVPDPAHLPPLADLANSEAIALFVDRAKAARPAFELTEDNARAIAEICARLEGLPLALELAAARVKLLAPEAILSRLDDRLDLLTSSARDLPERQRTLRATIAWSYELLTEDERRLFARLGAFLGGAALSAIVEVVRIDELEALDLLASLADQSLLRRVDDDEPRVEMLETIHEFAVERLNEGADASELREAHALAFAALAEAAEPLLLGEEGRRWLDKLAREHDNLRAAFLWSMAQQRGDIALRLVGSLWRFWQMRGHLVEGRERAQEALRLPSGDDTVLRGRALVAAGGLAYWQADFAAARLCYEESLELRRQIGDEAAIAESLYNLCFTYWVTREDPARGRELAEESLAIYRRLNDEAGIANTLWALGGIEMSFEEPRIQAARGYYAEARELFTKLGNRPMIAWAVFMAAGAEAQDGQHARSLDLVIESLRQFVELGDVSGYALALSGIAAAEWAEGRREEAVRIAAAAARLEETSGVRLSELTVGRWIEGFDRGEIKQDQNLARAWAEGAASDPEAIVTEILGPGPASPEPN